jgi:hypothetical protein
VFQSLETDWGFSQFLPTEQLKEGDGFVVDDTITITCHIKVLRDERYNTQIRATTGYVGLKNQGATCYMNSLLQYLYNIPYFRKVGAGAGSSSTRRRRRGWGWRVPAVVVVAVLVGAVRGLVVGWA